VLVTTKRWVSRCRKTARGCGVCVGREFQRWRGFIGSEMEGLVSSRGDKRVEPSGCESQEIQARARCC
jgi:hypothetical protein